MNVISIASILSLPATNNRKNATCQNNREKLAVVLIMFIRFIVENSQPILHFLPG